MLVLFLSMGHRFLIILRITLKDHMDILVFPYRFSYISSYKGTPGLEVALVVCPEGAGIVRGGASSGVNWG